MTLYYTALALPHALLINKKQPNHVIIVTSHTCVENEVSKTSSVTHICAKGLNSLQRCASITKKNCEKFR
jgi:hypothetical protein